MPKKKSSAWHCSFWSQNLIIGSKNLKNQVHFDCINRLKLVLFFLCHSIIIIVIVKKKRFNTNIIVGTKSDKRTDHFSWSSSIFLSFLPCGYLDNHMRQTFVNILRDSHSCDKCALENVSFSVVSCQLFVTKVTVVIVESKNYSPKVMNIQKNTFLIDRHIHRLAHNTNNNI